MSGKRIKTVGIVLACVVLATLAVVIPAHFFKSEPPENATGETTRYIYYYPEDYEKDISLDKVYQSYSKDLTYYAESFEQRYALTEDPDTVDPEAAFFLGYFQALIDGDGERLETMFAPGYFSETPRFTKQMIHDEAVGVHSQSVEEVDGGEITLFNFVVKYAIFQNNGSYRRGVASDEIVPQVYQLFRDESGAFRIYRILDLEVS